LPEGTAKKIILPMNGMEICSHDKCTGCAACVNACASHCISMKEDALGCLYPEINEKKCLNCNLCRKVCPSLKTLPFQYPGKCYASWITDKKKRKICASGGIGTAISEYVLRHEGVVFGSRYDDNMNPVMSYTEKIEELEHFKGSRYVQSSIDGTLLKKVKDFLCDNRWVLFIGTPCQIAGLKSFLRKDYDNLLTVDLLCHGVSPSKYLAEEVSYLQKKYQLKNIADIRFRGNDENNYCLSLWNKDKQKLFPKNTYFERMLLTNRAEQYYITGFLFGITMRENCYNCTYARPERISDITIGDFIGIGFKTPFDYPKRNVSSVLLNTEKGENLYREVSKENPHLMNVERDYSERLQYKHSLVIPFPAHPLREPFKEIYLKSGYLQAIHEVLAEEMRKRKIKCIKSIPVIPLRIFRFLIRESLIHLKLKSE
jgi:ferredoxin